MEDAAGAVSLGLAMELTVEEGRNLVTVTADEEWLSDAARVYPVRIDPTQTYVDASQFGLYGVEEGSPSIVVGDNSYPYVGYDDGIASGNWKNYGKRHLRCRTYVGIDYDFASLGENAKIEQAYLNICQITNYSGGSTQIGLYQVDTPWSWNSLTWDSQVGYNHTYLNYVNAAPSRKGWLAFDITEYVNNRVQGLVPNNGLVLKALDESSQCEVYYNKTSSYGPSITVEWEEVDPDDPFLKAYDLKDLLINLRPVTEKSVDGKLKLDGVFADGLATAHAQVVYQLTGGEVYTTEAAGQYLYPDSSAFEEQFPEGTKYKSLDSNWQTGLYADFAFDTLYQIQAAAAKDGETSGLKESDSFLVYQVKQYDTLPKIAAYYGVPLDMILKDNRVQDVLVGKSNTLFIRSPRTNVPYTSALDDADKAAIDRALMGRGLHCEFGFEPVNLNTGNFYLETQDASIGDLGGDFAIERSYNSLGAGDNSAFGKGWSFNYEESLSLEEPGVYCYRRSDGSSLLFTAGEDGVYRAPAGYGYTLAVVTAVNDAGETYNSRYEITDREQRVRGFNSYGLMTDVTDRQGHTTALTYDEAYRLTNVTSPSGKTYGVTCDDQGRITAVTRPDGAVLSYRYDSAGNLAEAVDANGGTVTYQYDDAHRMTSWKDANGNTVIVNTYDEKGRVTEQVDANGNHAYFRYGDHSTTTIDNLGQETVYQYDGLYRTTSITYPDGKAEYKSYNEANLPASATDRAGNTTSCTYDAQGNLLTETRADGSSKSCSYNDLGLLVAETDHNGNTTTHTYDEKGNLLSTTTPLGNTTRYGYDELSRCVSQTDPLGNVTTFTYEGAWLTGTQFCDGSARQYGYNGMGLVTSVTDELGRTSSQDYDRAGNLLAVTTPEGNTTRYTYDKTGLRLSETDPEGNTTRYTYDKVGNQTGTALPEGQEAAMVYDGNYRKIQEIGFDGTVTSYGYDAMGNATQITDGAGGVHRYAYDALGNVVSMTDALGNTSSYRYDMVKGLVTAQTDRAGAERSFSYDANGNRTAVTYGDGGQASMSYDADGRLISETDVLGNTKDYSYDRAGRLLKITDSLGTVAEFAYDGRGSLLSMTDGNGNTTRYTYDRAGQLLSVTDGNGNTTRYAYDGDGRQTAATDAAGASASYHYGKNGWLLEEADRNGNTVKYTYNGNGDRISVTDQAGYVSRSSYDGEGRLTGAVDPLEQTEGYAYDENGNLTAYTDPAGNTYTYRYDGEGNQVELGLPDGRKVGYTYDGEGRIQTQTAPNGLVTSYTYDGEGRILSVSDSEGGRTTYTYDGAGNTTSETDALGNVTRYAYDRRGRLTEVVYADGSSTSYTYDGTDRVAAETDAAGTVTEFSYDAVGNVTRILVNGEKATSYDHDRLNQVVGETNALGARKTYAYDREGHVLASTDENGITTSYGYDSRYNLTSQTDGNGGTTQYAYDALSRLVAATDALGEQEQYRYDALGQLVQYQDKAGNVTEYVYDAAGNLASETSPLGAVRSYTYDAADVLTSVTDALGNVTAYENDKKGNVLRLTQADGGEYTYRYDVLGRMTSVTTPLAYTTDFEYNEMGRLTGQTDSLGRNSRYGYDVLGNLTEETAADGSTVGYSYDAYGNRTAVVDQLGHATRYSYDLAGRLTEETDPLGAVTSYAYDPAGALTELTRPGSRTTAYQYDKNYNVTGITDPLGHVTAYGYDALDRLVTETDALSHQSRYAYDVLDRATAYTDRRGYSDSYGYDAHGNVTAYTDFGGKTTEYRYDLNDNMTRAADARGGKTYYEYDGMDRLVNRIDALERVSSYTYDAVGNLLSETDPTGRSRQYTYDPAGRMASYIRPDGSSIHYDYDAVNNLVGRSYQDKNGQEAQDAVLYGYNARGERVCMSDEAGESSYTYDALGRIVTAVGVTGKELSYTYDEAGNLASITYPDGSVCTYAYDKDDNLVSVTDGEGNTTSYRYDALDRLVRTERPNHTRTEVGYDPEGNITSLVNIDSRTEQEISSYRYTYDEMGYITEEVQEETLELYCGLHQFLPAHGHPHFLTRDGRCSQGIHKKHGHCCMEVTATVKRSYAYDENYQLLRVEETGSHGLDRVTTYTYDAAGNRTGEKVVDGRCTTADILYVYNDSNQLVRSIRREGWHRECTSYTYDANGNLTLKSQGKCREVSYSYDMEDRLRTIYEGKRLLMAATYNGDGQKVFTLDLSPDTGTGAARSLFLPEDATEAEEELYSLVSYGCSQRLSSDYLLTEYINDVTKENEEVLMKEARNSYRRSLAWEDGHCQVVRTPLKEKYVYGMERISFANDSGSGYYLYDALGNVRKEMTAGGRVTASYRYDSYGNVTAEVRLPEAGIPKPCRKVYGAISGLVLEGLALGSLFHGMLRDLFWGVEPLESMGLPEGMELLEGTELLGGMGHPAGRNGRCIPGGNGNRKDVAAMSYFPAVMFGYRGEETNRNTSLIYLRYRYYNPATADFISEDSYAGSLERPLSQNRYLYVEGNPLNYEDPSGHKKAWTAAKPAVGIGKGIKNSVVSGTLGKNAGSAAARLAAAAGIQVPVADKVKSVARGMAGGRSAGTGKKVNVGVYGGSTLGLLKELGDDHLRGQLYGKRHACGLDDGPWYRAWEEDALAKVKHPDMFGYGETVGEIVGPLAMITTVLAGVYLGYLYVEAISAKIAAFLSSLFNRGGREVAVAGASYVAQTQQTGGKALDVVGIAALIAEGGALIKQVSELQKNLEEMNGQSDASEKVHENQNGTNNNTGSNEVGNLLDEREELTGSTRDKLLDTVQDDELAKIVNELYRPGATVGDGGTASMLVNEFNNGTSTHLLKAQERLRQLKNLVGTGKLGLNDLDVAEALIRDLEYAVGLFN